MSSWRALMGFLAGSPPTRCDTVQAPQDNAPSAPQGAMPAGLYASPLAQMLADQQKAAVPLRKPLPNPGQYEGLMRMTMGTLKCPEAFDGFQLMLAKPLTPQFAVNHSILMGTSFIPKQLGACLYSFGANVAYNQGKVLLISRLDKMGRMEGRYMHTWNDGVMTKVISQLSAQEGQSVCYGDLDLTGTDWCAQFRFGNMGGGTYLAAANYLQSVTEHTALGADMQFIPARSKCVSKFGVRTTGVDWLGVMEYSTQGTVVCQYMRRVSPRLSLASELQLKTATRDTKVSFGYKYTLHQSVISGNINSGGLVQVTVKEMWSPMLSFMLSAEMDHKNRDCKFGYGLNIGQ